MPKVNKTTKPKSVPKSAVVSDLRPYELTVIVSGVVKAEKRAAVLESVNKKISGLGGRIKSTDQWGLKDLSYPIAKQMSGWYALLNIEIPADSVSKLDKELRENEKLLRHLIVKMQ